MKGSMTQRSPGTWSMVFDMGTSEAGGRQQKRVTFRGTKRQAEAELARMLHALNTGGFVEPSKTTAGEFLVRWLACVKASVSPKSHERYSDIVNAHLVPVLGRHLLAKLSPLAIQAAYAGWLENGRRDGKGGLSPVTVQQHHRILREALQQGVKWQLLVRNPCDLVEPPRAPHRERPTLDQAGILRLLTAGEGSPLYMPCLLASFCGLRRGEVLGLRWEDVDLKAAVLHVRQAAEETRAGGLAFKTPKTAKSRRAVALPALVVRALLRHKATQAEERLRLGELYENRGLVVVAEAGRPFSPHLLSRNFPGLVKRAGLPPVHFHDLRHSHATLLLLANVHPKIVSERLGHANISITLDRYSHAIPGMQEGAAASIDAAFGTLAG